MCFVIDISPSRPVGLLLNGNILQILSGRTSNVPIVIPSGIHHLIFIPVPTGPSFFGNPLMLKNPYEGNCGVEVLRHYRELKVFLIGYKYSAVALTVTFGSKGNLVAPL